MKITLFILFSLSVLSGAHANEFSDCKKEDQCKFETCAAQVVEAIDNKAQLKCRKVFKFSSVQGRHVYAYREIWLMIDAEGKPSGNTIRLK
jgi:hypothetical protein